MLRGCTSVMLMDLLYASYDEGGYYMPVMMSVYYTPGMMRGRGEGLLYDRYDGGVIIYQV